MSLMDLIIMMYYNKERPMYQLTVFPIFVYKTVIRDEDFNTFLHLSSYENKFPKISLLELCRYSVNISPIFTVYFAKCFKKELRRYTKEIIDSLILSVNEVFSQKSINNEAIFLEEKLYFIESVLENFSLQQARDFKDTIEKMLTKGSDDSKDETQHKPHKNGKHAYYSSFSVSRPSQLNFN